MKRPEILAPAGNLEKLKTAYLYGADACYMGMKAMSMRVKGSTQNIDEIEEALKIAKQLGKKLYLTMNIHAHENKMNFLELEIQHLKDLHEKGLVPNGLLISDPGMMMTVQEKCPFVDIHLSTQANTLNSAACEFWAKLGVTRVVFGREISLREVQKIREKLNQKSINVELEAFVHGAMCMAYSGRCLLSNFMSNRDANEGMCSHVCRWNYKLYNRDTGVTEDEDLAIEPGPKACCNSKSAGDNDEDYVNKVYIEEEKREGEYIPVYEDEEGTTIMSSKDMCMIDHLKEVAEAGIDSCKIEGRHKTVYYTAITSRAYKQAMDLAMEGNPPTPELIDLIESVNTRGYFAGFWFGKPGAEGQKYTHNRGDYNEKYCFAGVIRNIEGRKVYLEVKNRLERGDALDIITPERNIPLTLNEFRDAKNGKLLETASAGQAFLIEFETDEDDLKIGYVLRKKLRNHEVQKIVLDRASKLLHKKIQPTPLA